MRACKHGPTGALMALMARPSFSKLPEGPEGEMGISLFSNPTCLACLKPVHNGATGS